MGAGKNPRPAYVVDEDENGKQVRGTVRSATTKEKPKLSQRDSRPGKPKKSHSDTVYPGEKASGQAQAVEIMTEKEVKLERRKSTSASIKSPRKSGRPPSSHENRAFPKISIPTTSRRDDPSHFGIPTPTSYGPPVVSQAIPMQIPLRPRAITNQAHATRPLSYHQAYTSSGGYGPPLSMSAFYSPAPIITPSYPPPSPSSSYIRYASTPQATTPQADYFTQQITAPPSRPLSARFDTIPRMSQNMIDPISRTTSAFGIRDAPRHTISESYEPGYYEDSYASRLSDGATRRRESIRGPSALQKEEADYVAMPPPPVPRPGILRRPTNDYPDEHFDSHTEYRDGRARYRADSSPRRPTTKRNSVSYDLGKDSERVRVETANNSRRRQSYYGQSASTGSSGYEDKLNQAASYQEDVGGPSIPLTADMLRKQQRRQAGSSRSTKSSGSRDESDYRKSATTRTTRSGSGNDDENVTIKVTGQARVMVGGAQIDCNEGGEIQIMRQQKTLRNGSERSSSEYGGQRQIDDRRSRIDRPTGRTRLSSQQSYTRSTPQYPMDNYM